MKNFTLKRLLKRKEKILVLAMFGLLMVFGCYEFSSIHQPTEANSESSFDVPIVMKEDAAEGNDWTYEDGTLLRPGLFGVLIPEGWTVTDNIAVTVKSTDTALDGDGVLQTATSDHSGEYVLVQNTELATQITTANAPADGYYWWAAKTSTDVDLAFFDSLYFTITVNTDDQVGEFFLQYTAGDTHEDRSPVHFKSEPKPITITQKVGVNDLLNNEAISVYPNPSYGHLNIELAAYNGEIINYLIYDLRGRKVLSGQITNSHTMLDLVDVVPGAYVIRLESADEILTHKFLRN